MTVKKTATATAAATADVKQEIYKQCIESAIATANRIYDFRMREIDLIVDQYIDMVPREIRSKKISSFSN